jgi:hypothetical protein
MTVKPTECQHTKFITTTGVGRISQVEGGPIMRYTAEIKIHCAECGLPFRFLGLPFGSHPTSPRLSVDSIELRAPIEPAHVVEICGQPVVAGRA